MFLITLYLIILRNKTPQFLDGLWIGLEVSYHIRFMIILLLLILIIIISVNIFKISLLTFLLITYFTFTIVIFINSFLISYFILFKISKSNKLLRNNET